MPISTFPLNSELYETPSNRYMDGVSTYPLPVYLDDLTGDAPKTSTLTWVVKEFNTILSQEGITPEILEFCRDHNLLSYLYTAIDLVMRHFPCNQEFHLEVEQDPETDDEWLVLDITIKAEVDEVLKSYDQYTTQLISLVPWPERDKLRLSYNIL